MACVDCKRSDRHIGAVKACPHCKLAVCSLCSGGHLAREAAELQKGEGSGREVILENLQPESLVSAAQHQRMPARHFLFRCLVLAFWTTIALNLYLLASDYMEGHWAALGAALPIGAFLVLYVVFELATSRVEIEQEVDADGFRAWEFGALYTRMHELTIRATVKDVEFTGEPFMAVFDLWIGETTPRVPDGDDLDTLSVSEVRSFLLVGPTALNLRFDGAPPIYLWKQLVIDSHAATPHQVVFRERILVPNGVWWLGVANRTLDHAIDLTIDLEPVWTSPKSWVLPLEGREYACHL